MKFGIFSVVDHYPHELDRTADRFYAELLEQAEAADELGFESFWVAEHHFHEYGAIPRPAILLAAAAQRTRHIGLGAAVVVLPFDHPLRIAEDYALVDRLSNGRAMLGVGSGYLRHEFDGFGIAPEEKRARFDESLEIILEAWKGESFSYDGAYHSVDRVRLNVTPLQHPHPPLWVAILSNQAAAFVGRRGLPIMMIPYATTEEFSELSETVQAYRTAFVEGGGRSEEATVRFGLHVCCAEETSTARADARTAMERYVRTRLYARQRPFEELIAKDLVAFGAPGEIVRVARRYRDAGLTHFMAILNFGGMDHRNVLRSMELMAREVLPEFAGG